MAFEDYGAEGSQYDTHTTQQYELGTRMNIGERVYHYASVGSAGAVVVANVMQAAVEVATNAEDMALATTAAGSRTVVATLGATAATENQFKDGYFNLNNAAGEGGHYYVVASHPAASGGATCEITLKATLQTAITNGTETGGLTRNSYQDVIIAPTTVTGAPVGVTNIDIAASSFGWLQTWGPCAVTTDSTLAVGKAVVASTATAGYAGLNDTSGSTDGVQIGSAMSTAPVNTERQMIYLKIAP